MAKCLGLNQNNDIYLGEDGNLVVVVDLQAIITTCETISKAQLGEMILSTTQGIPNFETVWVGVPQLGIWQSYLRNALQNVNGVENVSDLTISKIDNTLVYVATIKTQFGSTQISG